MRAPVARRTVQSRHLLCLALANTLPLPANAVEAVTGSAVVAEFNPAFLRSPVDVRMFSTGNPVPPGTHRIDLYMNGQWRGREQVRFENSTADTFVASPCYDSRLLLLLGLDLDRLQAQARHAIEHDSTCSRLEDIISGSQADYDAGDQRLNVKAPQALLKREARGYVSPELWDDGITAATLRYDYNAYRARAASGYVYESQYLGIRAGFNAGAWRLRYHGSAQWDRQDGVSHDSALLYAQRAIAGWHSKLTLGRSFTDGQVFDSIGFSGIQLASEDRMYADSQRGFAPIVRGVANSNARVRITQRGSTVLETTVPPGPFVIDDLYPNGTGGDLQVTVIEADGSEQSFTVNYASTAELLRPGTTRYGLTLGRYHSSGVRYRPGMLVATLRHGASNLLTGYSGTILSEHYRAGTIGIALNTLLGAISTDITHSHAGLVGSRTVDGLGLHLAYAKRLPILGTNVTLASYRYSSNGFYDATDAFLLRDRLRREYAAAANSCIEQRKNRFTLSASQNLGRYGHLSVSTSTQDYWGREGSDTEYVIGYNNQFARFGLGANASRTYSVTEQRWDNQLSVTASIPLGGKSGGSMSTGFTHGRDIDTIQANLSSRAGRDNQFHYNAYANAYSGEASETDGSIGASVSWTTRYSTLGASSAVGRDYHQYGASASGGLVAYRDGVLLTPEIGDTVAIVHAEHAEGAGLSGYDRLRLNRHGLGLVPYLRPYRENRVDLDPKGLSTDVALKFSSQHVAPTDGAVSLLHYDTEYGYSMLLRIHDGNDKSVPFGASVQDAEGGLLGNVGQGGQALLRLRSLQGTLEVGWGEGLSRHCWIDYAFPADAPRNAFGYRSVEVTCREHQP